jgi:hypothetical protein
VRTVVGVLAGTTLLEGAIDVLLVVVALQLLGLGPSGVGQLNAAWGVGGLVGGMAAFALLSRGRLPHGLLAGSAFAGAAMALIAVWSPPGIALALLIVLGIGYALIDVSGVALLQRLVPAPLLGRVFGVQETVDIATTGAGSALVPLLLGSVGTRTTLVAVGCALPALTALRWRALDQLDAQIHVPPEELALLRGLDVFAEMRPHALEHLARHAVPVSVGADAVIFSEGDISDRFYAIAAGNVEMLVDGAPAAWLGPGDYFGEHALLRHGPRVATAHTRTPVELYTIERADFLAATRAHHRTLRAAHATARHLGIGRDGEGPGSGP